MRVGDKLRVKNERGEFEIDVLGLSSVRGSASVAQTLYRETEASIAARKQLEEARKLMPEFEIPVGRPSKKDRRRIAQFRGR